MQRRSDADGVSFANIKSEPPFHNGDCATPRDASGKKLRTMTLRSSRNGLNIPGYRSSKALERILGRPIARRAPGRKPRADDQPKLL
jgi:hypothetical protein